MPAAGYPFHQLAVRGIDRRNPLRAARAVGPGGGRGAARAAPAALHRRRRRDGRRGLRGRPGGPGRPHARPSAGAHRGRQPPRGDQPAARAVRRPGVPRLSDRGQGRAPRYEVVGRPLPAGTGEADRARGAPSAWASAPEEACVLVFGGSLGARRINDAAIDAFGSGAPGAVLHASGRRDHPDLQRRLEELGSSAALPPARLPVAVRGRPGGGRPRGGPLRAARCSRWRPPGCRRSSCPTRTPRPTIRPSTPVTWSGRARRWWCPTDELDGPRLAREVAALLGAPDRMRRWQGGAEVASRRRATDRGRAAGAGRRRSCPAPTVIVQRIRVPAPRSSSREQRSSSAPAFAREAVAN